MTAGIYMTINPVYFFSDDNLQHLTRNPEVIIAWNCDKSLGISIALYIHLPFFPKGFNICKSNCLFQSEKKAIDALAQQMDWMPLFSTCNLAPFVFNDGRAPRKLHFN